MQSIIGACTKNAEVTPVLLTLPWEGWIPGGLRAFVVKRMKKV